ncbi:hypothetical protein KGM_215860 [Danaus plexippus plexippus]|uniref:Uncharacterized protein n=1 Tax=Danaus plexippus plexippus TaxID=278856 RepID=A0A212EQZ1_DANPL|nr:hypothetical protein KGM_215860 [Danaus plexippus plexippus]
MGIIMEKVESALDVLSRAATMVQPCPAYPASDTDSFVTIATTNKYKDRPCRRVAFHMPTDIVNRHPPFTCITMFE